jgi:hypothetical protein
MLNSSKIGIWIHNWNCRIDIQIPNCTPLQYIQCADSHKQLCVKKYSCLTLTERDASSE